MRQSLKISLSLLVSLALFAAFAVLAFSGLFAVLQATFFQPRMLREREQTLAALAQAIERHHQLNIARFSAVLGEPSIPRIFAPQGQWSKEDIFNRGNLFAKLLDEYPYLQGARFLDPDGKKLHFSTYREDSEIAPDRQKTTFRKLADAEKSLDGNLLVAPAGQAPRLIIDGAGGRFIYSLPVAEADGSHRGTALFFARKEDLEAALLRDPRLSFRELLLLDGLGVLVNFPESEKALIEPVVAESWRRRAPTGLSSDTVVFETAARLKEKQVLLSAPAGRFGFAGLLVPYSAFELQPLMKAVLLASVFLTIFLLVFLLFNLRQDPLLVLSQRIKRFQLEILSEFIEGKEQMDWQRWRDELAGGRSELRSRIKRGVGRIPAGKEAELDGLIDRSWDEIIGIIEARIGQPAKAKVDIGYIEELIQKALDRGRITVSAGKPLAAPPSAPARREGFMVEEIGVEEVSEAEEAEEVAEPAAEPAAEAEEVLEAEELAEAEEAELAAEPPTAGEILTSAQPVAEELAEEAELLEEAEEEAPQAEAVEPALQPEELLEAEQAAEAVEAAEAEPAVVVSEEMLPELEPASEIVALAPEPQEELEELLLAESEVSAPGKAAPLSPAEAAPTPEAEELEAAEGAAEIEELEAAEGEEPQVIQELLEGGEELEVAEAAPGAGPLIFSAAETADQLEKLVAQGLIRAFSLSDVEACILEQRTSVVMKNGVYRIREEVLSGADGGDSRKLNRGLKALAEAVLSSGGSPAQEESGIGEILGTDFGADLAAELSEQKAAGRGVSYAGRERARKIQFYEDGLDYDHYLGQFRDGASETGKLKSLVEISRKIKAVNAAIFQKIEQTYSAVLRVGLLEKPERILFAPGEPFYDRFLKQRQAVLISARPASIAALAAKFNLEDLKYMQAALFLPAVYQEAQAYMFLGLPTKKAVELKDVITKLDIY